MPLVPRFLAIALVGTLLQSQVPQILGVSDIRPGMKGHGRTVFQAGKIESFDFEVMGVQRNAAPGHSIIWIKASGGPLAQTGIMQGMSGSPCYIDGKLIGALSSGPAFAKEPIAGITPIGEMLDQLKDLPELISPKTPLILPKLEPPKVLKSAMLGQMVPLSELMGGETLPFSMDLMGSELGPEAKALWQGAPVRFLTSAMAAPTPGAEASPLEPGGMVAIALMQGDMDFMGSGTITYVSGKKLLLFGHPMFNLGPVDLPMWSATVSGAVANYNIAFKMSQPVAPIGALRLDRSSGVAGVVGAEAHMIPLRLGLNLGGKKTLNFRFELMDHPIVTPFLASTAVLQTLTAHVRGLGFQSLSLQGNLKVTGQPPIQIENVTADLNAGRLAAYVGAMLQAVEFNPFERPQIEGISLTVKAEERLDLTSIVGARLMKARVKRGETLPVVVTLQNMQGVRETGTFNIQVPHSALPGKASLLVGDGLSLIASDPDERAVEIASLGDMVRMLNGALRNNHAYALLVQAQPGAGLRGSRLEGIPPTIGAQMLADGMSADNKLQRRILGRGVLPLEREVHGMLTLDVEIE